MSYTRLLLCCCVTADLPHRSWGILRAVRRKRWHRISQENALAFDTLSEWSQLWLEVDMVFLSGTSWQWLGAASLRDWIPMRSAWLHHYWGWVSHCLCGSVIVTMWYFIDPVGKSPFVCSPIQRSLSYRIAELYRNVMTCLKISTGFETEGLEPMSSSSRTGSRRFLYLPWDLTDSYGKTKDDPG